jgi:pimeloyl-ACP methyl ester carboxylesterase
MVKIASLPEPGLCYSVSFYRPGRASTTHDPFGINTTAADGPGREDAIEVDQIVLPAGGTELSALVAEPDAPRALVLALHGGGMTAEYFHGRAHPDLSLLALGRRLGFTVLAIDRPGYGHSRAALPDGQSLRDQTTTVFEALDVFAGTHATGDGVFVVAHSYGLKLALHLAAHPRGAGLLGLDGSGAVYRYRRDLAPGAADAGASTCPWGSPRELFWGDQSLYPPGTFDPGMRPVAPVPVSELREAARWTAVLPALAAEVRLPYQFTVAQHERWWQSTDPDLIEYRALFRAVPVMTIRRQASAGHNISLGWAARGYHLNALAFAEQCLLVRRQASVAT